MPSAALSRLSAVNIMLSILGHPSVNSIESAGPTVAEAQALLESTSRNLQSRGWKFNTRTNYTLTPDVNGDILIPTDALSVHVGYSSDTSRKYTVVGGKLFDRETQSFSFTAPLTASLVLLLDFDELPPLAQNLIAHRAGRLLKARREELPNLPLSLEELEAERDFENSESRDTATLLQSTYLGSLNIGLRPFAR